MPRSTGSTRNPLMSLTVIVRETALRNLARIRGEDEELFARTRRAISALANQPYPESAVAWGATGSALGGQRSTPLLRDHDLGGAIGHRKS
jgi:hypothetical protein